MQLNRLTVRFFHSYVLVYQCHRWHKIVFEGSLPGQTLLAATVGPMARDVDTLVLAMRTALCPMMFELDPICPPMPFNDEVAIRN